ncbi:MAG: hypothetical protein BGN95_24855 [Sphingomonas sp. 66-10]|nr:MAG: hypothetical protein BGN95_24855 [Sphingomonas sp. 66-10]
MPACRAGKPSARAASSIAGSEASDDCVLKATDWAGSTARANARNGVRARTATSRTNAVNNTIPPTMRAATYQASSAPTPRSAARRNVEGQREHAQRRQQQHPADDDKQRVCNALEELADRHRTTGVTPRGTPPSPIACDLTEIGVFRAPWSR